MKVGTKLTLSHLSMALVPVILLGIITVSIVSKKFLEIEEVADTRDATNTTAEENFDVTTEKYKSAHPQMNNVRTRKISANPLNK